MTDIETALKDAIYAQARDMASRGLFVRDDFGAPNIHAIMELTTALAAVVQGMVEEVKTERDEFEKRLQKIATWFGMVNAHAHEYGMGNDLALGHIQEALNGISGDALLERLAGGTRDQMIQALRSTLAEQAREIERLKIVLVGMREADRIVRGVTVSDWTPPPGWHSWADKCAALSAALERRGCHAPVPPECPSCEPSLAALRATPEAGE